MPLALALAALALAAFGFAAAPADATRLLLRVAKGDCCKRSGASLLPASLLPTGSYRRLQDSPSPKKKAAAGGFSTPPL